MEKFKSFFLHKIWKFLPVLGIFFISACKVDGNDTTEETFRLMNSPAGCFSCQLFRVVYNAAAQMSANAYLKLCDIALSLLVIGLTAWLFLHVLSIMVSLREPNLSKFWVQLFQKLFKGGFVAILIASKERLVEVINTLFEPIMLIFIDLSSNILRSNWASKHTTLANTLNSSFNVGPGFNRQIAVQLENLIYTERQ